MFDGPYGVYVAVAYGATVLILAGLVLSTYLDSRRIKRELDDMQDNDRSKGKE